MSIRRELNKRRQARRAARATEQGVAGHQATMEALAKATAKPEVKKIDIHGNPISISAEKGDFFTTSSVYVHGANVYASSPRKNKILKDPDLSKIYEPPNIFKNNVHKLTRKKDK